MKRKSNFTVSIVATLLLAVILALCCTGCNTTEREYDDADDAPKVMTVVDETISYTIYRHDETGVYYFCIDGGYGKSVCVMVNADGTPYTGAEGSDERQ